MGEMVPIATADARKMNGATRTHIDLFSGIGGFALACRELGIATKCFCEKSHFKRLILENQFRRIPIFEEIKSFQANKFRGSWLVTAGIPCTPFSRSGSKKEQATIVSSGMRLLKHSKKSNRIGFLSKILLTSQNWHCKRFPMIWKRWDINSNLSVFRLAPSAHYISENEFSLLPTPTTRIAVGNHYQRNRQGKVYPTLSGILRERLSPESVEAIMGFPIGWTASHPAAMRSSRKSPTRSSKQ